MNARDKHDLRRCSWSDPIGRGKTRNTRRKPAGDWLGGDLPTRWESLLAGQKDFVWPSAPERSSLARKGTTPHSVKKPVIANGLRRADNLGITPVVHPLIVITGGGPTTVSDATDAPPKRHKPLEIAILASLLTDPEGNDDPSQPGGAGAIPQTQTMVFSRPGSSSSLRIRVVPVSTRSAAPIPYADWSQLMVSPDRHKCFPPKTWDSRWLSGR